MDDGEEYLKISVVDTGVGIPEKDQDKLFKLFGFVQEAKLFNTNGIGLGLVISEQLVNKLGGKMSFTSKEGEGSNFSFTFKLN